MNAARVRAGKAFEALTRVTDNAIVSALTRTIDWTEALSSLGETYCDAFPIGVCVEPIQLREQSPLIAHHFRRLTAENSMKFGEICPSMHGYQFAKADEIVEFARQHSMKMTGHTLVWHQMVPAWLFRQGAVSAAWDTVARRMRNHIFTMMERYSDVIDNWDVVNEAISDTPGKMWRDSSERSQWFASSGGETYIAQAFQQAADAAAQVAPQIALYYNDYGLENSEKRHKVIDMVRALRKNGVRVDGVGIQGHIDLDWPTLEELGKSIDELAAEDLLVKISELDVSVYTQDDPASRTFQREINDYFEIEQRLARRYKDVFTVFRERSSKLTSVTLWGVSDDQSWLNGWPVRRKNYALLFDREHRPKAALLEILEKTDPGT
jgi:endo-1,4-beta-xylanase